MTSTELQAWLMLRSINGVGSVRLRQLVEAFGSPQAVLEASLEQISRLPRMDRKTAQAIIAKHNPDSVKRQIEQMAAQDIQLITYRCDTYPKPLHKIYDPPALLFVRGTLTAEDEVAIGVVGPRAASVYGKTVTQHLTTELVQHGLTIISGMARGIDRVAHESALNAGGRTLAILGCGVDVVYPPDNADLVPRIIENGALISELPLGTQPTAMNFPMRNRIISGMSLGVLVPEARIKSGALITADYAIEQGKDVFAVPGPIHSATSQGSNRLIKNGAKLVETVQDILEGLNPYLLPSANAATTSPPSATASEKHLPPLTGSELEVYQALSETPLHIDRLAKTVAKPTHHVLGTLLALELKGVVKALPGKQFVRA
ncbi:MAG: DNA-protecting protein DprA [Gemmatimonadetes bacterium]|nr:MAG: DNA-protecting protein DprA [Gemmatimonadota bacterium]